MASMRDGSRTGFFMLFREASCIYNLIRSEERAFSVEEIKFIADQVSDQGGGFFTEPAFTVSDSTALGWYEVANNSWVQYTAQDSAQAVDQEMQLIRDGQPEAYLAWAADSYEIELPLEAIQAVFSLEPLSQQTVTELNPDLSLDDLEEDATEIGFPLRF